MDLLLLTDDDKSHYVCIKDFNRSMFHKRKSKKKNGSVRVVYNVLVMKMCWQNIKKIVWVLMANHL